MLTVPPLHALRHTHQWPLVLRPAAHKTHTGETHHIPSTLHICVCVHAGRFVRITLASVSKKTRAINRNCHPLWEQQLVLPVEGLSEAEPLLVEVFDKNYNGKVFLGQVRVTVRVRQRGEGVDYGG